MSNLNDLPLTPVTASIQAASSSVYLPHYPVFYVWLTRSTEPDGNPEPTGSLQFFIRNSDETLTSLGYFDLLQHGTEEQSELDSYIIYTLTSPGTYTIFANYSGDNYYAEAVTGDITVTIYPARIEAGIAFTSSANPVLEPNPVTVSVRVYSLGQLEGGGVPPTSELPTGSVTLYNGNPLDHATDYAPVNLGTVTLASGLASFTLSSLPAGVQELYAVYSGDANYTPLTSNGYFQSVSAESSESAGAVQQFYFAWAESDELEFTPRHHRFDEQILSIHIEHAEGDFPACEVVLKNPRVGLLAPGRKVWAWLAYNSGSTVTPLFFGRLVGIPKDVHAEACTLSFISRPVDFDDQKEALANSLKQLPYYDPLFVAYEQREDPDHVLEGYSKLWHCDRFSSSVTVSDIVQGEDGTLTISPSTGFYEGLGMSYSGSPIRRVVVNAKVDWTQTGFGTMDITQQVINAFANANTSSEYATGAGGTEQQITDIYGNGIQLLPGNITYLMGADGMVNAWPKTGQGLGGGWQVGVSSLDYLGVDSDGDILVGPIGIQTLPAEDASGVFTGGGVCVQVINQGSPSFPSLETTTLLWIPVRQVLPHLEVVWNADRKRTEVVTFNVDADLQNLCTTKRIADNKSSDSIAYLTLPSAHADEYKDIPFDSMTEEGVQNSMPIQDARRSAYFKTDRGQNSLQYMILRARALILARARAVEVKAQTAFSQGLQLSCRWNATVQDYRLPGGSATGKVLNYVLDYDGAKGFGYCEVTIGCMIGRYTGGQTEDPQLWIETGFNTEDFADISSGSASYVDDYETDYAALAGAWQIMPTGDLAWCSSDVANTVLDDDGLDLFQVDVQNNLLKCYVDGGLDAQWGAASQSITGYQKKIWGLNNTVTDPVYSSVDDVRAKVNAVTTVLNIELTGMLGGPFITQYNMTTTLLNVPQTIDLEAASNA